MKTNFKTWILGVCIVFLCVFGILIFKEYMANHTYYYDMLKNQSNLSIILATLVCAALPTAYISHRKGWTFKGLMWVTWIGLALYGISYATIRENILGTGAIMRVINSGIVFWMGAGVSIALMSIWSRLYQQWYSISNWWTRRSLLLSFGLWFGAFIVFNYILILANVYYPLVNRLQVILLGLIIWKSSSRLKQIGQFLTSQLQSLSVGKKQTTFWWIMLILILISFAYYMIGFKLAFIPYPTAWDANHAYMLMPNAISGSYGWTRNNSQGTWYMPVYLSFVSFFFSLIKGLGSKFWLAPDTFGVEMNYLTAIFTFISTLGIVDKVLDMVSHKDTTHKNISYAMGWFIKILWLTSGMWAFLVFVDNKTDFGIMYLSCLWLLSGLGYLDYIIKKYNHNKEDDISKREWLNDLYLSAIFFWLAVVSKITALFDAMNFVLLIVWLLLGGVVLVWLWFIIMWALTYMGLNGVSNFISKSFANIAWFGWWALITLLGLWQGQRVHSYSYRPRLVGIVKQLALWAVIFVLTMVVLKLPIWLYRYFHDQTEIKNLPKELTIGKTYEKKNNQKFVLLASNNTFQVLLAQQDSQTWVSETPTDEVIDQNTWVETTWLVVRVPQEEPTKDGQLSMAQCSLSAVGVSDAKDLYKTLLDAPGDWYTEDVWRYVWFGQKEWSNPRWWFLVPSKSCISLNRSASTICKNISLVETLTKDNVQKLVDKLPVWSDGYQLLSTIIDGFDSGNKLSTFVSDSQKKINDFRRDKVITKEWTKVYIPYKVVTPLNVTFNRSLQNLSSYYTDIGIVRLMLQFFILVAIIYWLRSRNKLLRSVNLVALIGWLLWIAIGGGIIRYGIGLITWTIMWFVLFVHDLYIPSESQDHHTTNHTLFYLFVGLFTLFWLIQLTLNFVRIASQWGSWPFLQYKYSNGQEAQIDENLQQKVVVKFPYKRTDILNLQFPHYNKVVSAINTQTGDEINLIAGTYAQYRVNDQTKLYGDGFLWALWKDFSDGDLCKSYLRLKDKNMKYMIIDPNIASIVMWWGNSSLMDRFFAKLDPSGKIVVDGALTTLGKLVNGWYVSLYGSNNLWAKYGYGLPGEYLKAKFGITNDEDLALLRARLATTRYRWNQQQMVEALSSIFTERVANGQAVSDIAEVFGKNVDETKLNTLITKATKSGFAAISSEVKNLNQDERFVLLNYLNIVTTYNKQPSQFGSVATNIVTQSLGWWSQLIIFEVK